jgi:hypothetical protein
MRDLATKACPRHIFDVTICCCIGVVVLYSGSGCVVVAVAWLVMSDMCSGMAGYSCDQARVFPMVKY